MSSIGGLSSPSGGITNPETMRFELFTIDTEESLLLTNNVKQVRIYNDGDAVLKISYQAGESDVNFFPVYPGDVHFLTGITSPTFTIYYQSPKILQISIEIWR